MIVGYRNKQTAQFAGEERSKRSPDLSGQPVSNSIAWMQRLRSPTSPLCRAIALRRSRANEKDRGSIRINDQWRIRFTWGKGEPGPSDVEIVDYH